MEGKQEKKMLYSGYQQTLQKHGKIQVYTTEDVLKTIDY